MIPKDSTDKLGNLFWSDHKRFPEPIAFDPIDPLHVMFVTATANLLA
jgi:ubiquitin-activating enzyme E1